MSIAVKITLGAAFTGLTLKAVFIDGTGTNVGSAITSGFVEIGNGDYLLTTNIPNGFTSGAIKLFDASGPTYLTMTDINPEDYTTPTVPVVNLTVTPISAAVATSITGATDIEIYTETSTPITWTIADAQGNPIDLSGKSIRWTLFTTTIPSRTILVMESDGTGGEITISDASVTLNLSNSDTSTAGRYRYSLRNLTDKLVLATGKFDISQLP